MRSFWNLISRINAAVVVAAGFGGDRVLIFDGYGKPDSGGKVVVSSGAHEVSVSVDPETGKDMQ